MEAIVERASNGYNLNLNRDGDQVYLRDDSLTQLDDFMGARVWFIPEPLRVRCEMAIPETSGTMRWHFDVDKRPQVGGGLPQECSEPNTLEDLIGRIRTMLNGRL